MEKIFVSKNGLKKLEDELHHLKTARRKEIAARIEEAKEYGDISENSEYEEAKNEQALVESRIAEIGSMIKNSSLIENAGIKGRVGYGSLVKVRINQKTKIFRIVGSVESNPAEGMISCNSPIAKALIGLKKGEEAEVLAPSGVIKYKVIGIK